MIQLLILAVGLGLWTAMWSNVSREWPIADDDVSQPE